MRQSDLFILPKPPWNAGRPIGPKAPLKPKHIWAMRQQLKVARRVRDLAMFNCALDSKLRACDLVRLRVSDVAPGGALRQRSIVIQQKTGRPVPFEIKKAARDAIAAWLKLRAQRDDDWLFPSRSRPGQHIGTRQYARLVDKWVRMIDLEPQGYGTHSLRRTKVSLVYKKTGNLRACQLLLGHRKLEITVRYLGIEVDDALEMSEQIDLCRVSPGPKWAWRTLLKGQKARLVPSAKRQLVGGVLRSAAGAMRALNAASVVTP